MEKTWTAYEWNTGKSHVIGDPLERRTLCGLQIHGGPFSRTWSIPTCEACREALARG